MSPQYKKPDLTLRTVKEFFVGGRRFCCCLPTRFGVLVGSMLTFLVAGTLAVILWFEVATERDVAFTSNYHVAFVLAGVLETLLFVASVIGFIGAVAQKQLFVTIYCYFLYVQFLILLGVISFVLWKVNHVANTDIVVACQEAIRNAQGQQQCTGLLNITRGTLIGIAVLVLVVQLYGVLIVTRYMRELRDKKSSRRAALASQDDFLVSSRYNRYSSLHDEHDDGEDGLVLVRHGRHDSYYDPYDKPSPFSPHQQGHTSSSAATYFPLSPRDMPTLGSTSSTSKSTSMMPHTIPLEEGYREGLLTYDTVMSEEQLKDSHHDQGAHLSREPEEGDLPPSYEASRSQG